MNKYYKNMILCSELDYHCILCKESFETVPDVEKHIRWEQHRRSIKNQNCIPKYKEFVHKIGEIYYCEICNCVVKSDVLQKHNKSLDHKENKANPGKVDKRSLLGERDESGSIKFPNLLVNRLKWHGIHNGKCVLCNESVENVNDHVSITKHMVYIIQNKIIETSNNYFRTIDESRSYCFRCSNIIKEDQLNSHNCKKDNKKQKKNGNKNEESEKKFEMPDLLEIIADVEKDKYDINVKEKTAKCKLCNESIDATTNALIKHTEQYHEETIKYIVPEDHGKRRHELAVYGRENFIKLNEGGSKGYCSLCDIHISAHIKVAKEHVNGLRHKGHLELKGLRARKKHSLPGCRSLALQKFLKHLVSSKPLNAMCINFSLCVDNLSFMFITTIDHNKQTKGKCFCCDIVFEYNDLNEHWKTRKHRNALASADVLLIDEEFIRVIRPGLFHCGFCNQVFPFWEVMGKHIASWTHSIAKKKSEVACNLALQLYSEQETIGATLSDKLCVWDLEYFNEQ